MINDMAIMREEEEELRKENELDIKIKEGTKKLKEKNNKIDKYVSNTSDASLSEID